VSFRDEGEEMCVCRALDLALVVDAFKQVDIVCIEESSAVWKCTKNC